MEVKYYVTRLNNVSGYPERGEVNWTSLVRLEFSVRMLQIDTDVIMTTFCALRSFDYCVNEQRLSKSLLRLFQRHCYLRHHTVISRHLVKYSSGLH